MQGIDGGGCCIVVYVDVGKYFGQYWLLGLQLWFVDDLVVGFGYFFQQVIVQV